MEHLIFAANLVVFAWLVTRTSFFTATGLSKPQLVILFLLKVMAGILYGWIGMYYGELAQMSDTWMYHFESMQEYKLLLSDPLSFFSGIFKNSYQEGYTRFLASESSWWNDLKGTIFVKLLAVFNLFSFGNYYTNVIFYSYFTLFGPVAVYRVMKDVFQANHTAILLAVFLVPSFLYWTSGLHKEGLIFLGLSMVLFSLYFALKNKKLTGQRVLMMLVGILLVLTLRNFLIIPLLPALLAWVLSSHINRKSWKVFAGVYLVFALFFFTAGFFHPRLNFLEAVVSRQQAFLQLGGGSAVEVIPLQPTFFSFLANLPQAFSLSTIRPYPADVHHLLSLAAAAEINFLLLLVLTGLFFRREKTVFVPVLLFCLAFSFSVLLMIGYSVNILGAIVRYRSIVLILPLILVVAQTDWKRIGKWFGQAANIEDK